MAAEILEQTFAVSGVARLSLSNIRGSVDVRAGEDGSIYVKAVKQPETSNAEHTEIHMEQESDGSVVVKTKYEHSFFRDLFNFQPCKVDYVVTLPRSCVLKVSAVSSSCSVDELAGDLSFDMVSGDLSLGKLDGKLKIATVSGDVTAEGLTGALTLSTVSGRVEVRSAALSSVTANTVSGDIFMDHALSNPGPCRFTSVSGDVRLRLPVDFGCNAALQTVSGRISTNAPVRSNARSHGSQVIEIRGGGQKIYMNSVSGNLLLEQVGEAKDPAPTRREILAGVERGEISVEDALDQLA